MSSRSVPCKLFTPCACCRKVAVPVPDSYTWQDFLQQVLTRTSSHSDNLSTASHLLTSLGHNDVHGCTLQVQQKLKLSSVESVTLASVSQQSFTTLTLYMLTVLASSETSCSVLLFQTWAATCRVGSR